VIIHGWICQGNRTAAQVFLACLGAGCVIEVQAQQNDTEIAKAAENPIGLMINVPFQFNGDFGYGKDEQTEKELKIEPLIPVNFISEWYLITRTILPVLSKPDSHDPSRWHDGIGDIQLETFLSPRHITPAGWVWGVGPMVQVPSASSETLGEGKWELGPVAAIHSEMPGPWVFGLLVYDLWSVGGDKSRDTVKKMQIQPTVSYHFRTDPGGYLSTSPEIVADWTKAGTQRWTVPVGLATGQVFHLAGQPVNLQLAYYNNVVRPDNTTHWILRLQMQLVFPR
jgi:hypothetical protein